MYCYVVKWPVFRLQRGSAKSPIAPSNFSPLWPVIVCFFSQNLFKVYETRGKFFQKFLVENIPNGPKKKEYKHIKILLNDRIAVDRIITRSSSTEDINSKALMREVGFSRWW